jgi:hypothetical protein
MFGLHDPISEAALDPEWRALVAQQAHTLAALLRCLQASVAGAQRADAARLQVLAADAERFLVAQAQQHARLERARG